MQESYLTQHYSNFKCTFTLRQPLICTMRIQPYPLYMPQIETIVVRIFLSVLVYLWNAALYNYYPYAPVVLLNDRVH